MLYTLTAAKLFGVAVRIVGQREEAEEVLQESFVAVWQRAGDYDAARGSATGWLTTIVRHCAIDHLRRRAGRPESRSAPEDLLLKFAAGESTDRGAELSVLQRCLGELDEQPPSCSPTSTVSRARKSLPVARFRSEQSKAGSGAASSV